MTLIALYDASVLYPGTLRDLLIRIAQAGLVQAKWTDQILDEMFHALIRNNPRLDPGRLDRTRKLMNAAVRDCTVHGYERLIDALALPDDNDRHVLAAAIRAKADVIVTSDLRDFPKDVLRQWSVAAVPPDTFASDVQETGSAVTVLARTVDGHDTLFPNEQAVAHLIDGAATDLSRWGQDGIAVHAFFDGTYPEQVRAIAQPPPLVFTRGRLQGDLRAVAVIGSRRASSDGLRVARAIATTLARRNITVVSGLAQGIDTASHQAALAADGRTVAVLGTGIRRYYPATNKPLQERIATTGLVLSQFWPDTAPTRQSFPMRNAVMSGYAAATVIVEAGATSGARIHARKALEHGRPVILTDLALTQEWAQVLAARPGVHTVRSTAELLDIVEDILPVCAPEGLR